MKICNRIIAFLLTIGLTLQITGCTTFSKSNFEGFAEVRNNLIACVNQLDKEPGIMITGVASDPEKLLFKIGIGVEREITDARLKEVVQEYIINLQEKELIPYNLQLEDIDREKNRSRIIAEKVSNSTVIRWDP